uniref:Uncharacterized protein n=1 Tax=Romanomermis culicivorax TaxID=13658 RepID=A0A915KZ11_ROMCU
MPTSTTRRSCPTWPRATVTVKDEFSQLISAKRRDQVKQRNGKTIKHNNPKNRVFILYMCWGQMGLVQCSLQAILAYTMQRPSVFDFHQICEQSNQRMNFQ